MLDVWAECRDRVSPQSISNELIRVVESQEQIATNSIVDNLDEQAALEQMLEDTKPELPKPVTGLDYLLATPFRYPPLEHGSRFGTRNEPSIFYGSLSLTTVFAETGYYRFLFWLGMTSPPPTGKLITQHTVLGVSYKTKKGLKLQKFPFNDYEDYLISPSDYRATQLLGKAMRDHGIKAFEYKSARDIDHGLNAALFAPSALTSPKPIYKEQWLCEVNNSAVTFYSSIASKSIHKYSYETYLVKGEFPQPAV